MARQDSQVEKYAKRMEREREEAELLDWLNNKYGETIGPAFFALETAGKDDKEAAMQAIIRLQCNAIVSGDVETATTILTAIMMRSEERIDELAHRLNIKNAVF